MRATLLIAICLCTVYFCAEVKAFHVISNNPNDIDAKWADHFPEGPQIGGHKAVAVEGRIYSFGGNYEKPGEKIDVYSFDPSNRNWTKLEESSFKGEMPPCVDALTAVVQGHYIYLWGGILGWFQFSNILHRLDTRTLTWDQPEVQGDIPEARQGHSAVVINNKMYIFAGHNGHDYLNDTWALDTATFTWTEIIPTGVTALPRAYHTAVDVDGKIVVFGGHMLDEYIVVSRELYILDVETKEGVQQQLNGNPPEARFGHCAFTLDGFMYIFGGRDFVTAHAFNNLFQYDLAQNTWQEVSAEGERPVAQSDSGYGTIGNNITFFGGWEGYYDRVQGTTILSIVSSTSK